MALLDSIDAFLTDTVTVTRRPRGTYVDGIYVPSSTVTTFPVQVAIEPATGMQRVVGGRDQRSDEQGEQVYDVRQFFTRTKMLVRTEPNGPDPGSDADEVAYEGGTWVVFRVEEWTHTGQTYYRCVMVRKTAGAS